MNTVVSIELVEAGFELLQDRLAISDQQVKKFFVFLHVVWYLTWHLILLELLGTLRQLRDITLA